ncbi:MULTISPECIES: membrane protein insertase YidC [Bacillus]|uniref:membrane protein insertase YidC n=1 Tax=Bacillus TaxID=1386 RepID=UPI0003040886|nr:MULTISPECIES: membrane protein insertase YidC [Bacillus]
MEKKSNKVVSTAFKGITILIGVFIVGIFFGGDHTLAATTAASDSSPGFFQHYLIDPFTFILNTLANWFQGSYGLSIIAVTLLIRFCLMPLMLKSTKSQYVMRDKMTVMQPEMKVIQDKLKKAKSPEEKAKIQQEMMKLYQKHGVNPMASLGGCLPVLIQMPILMGFYYAIRNSPEISSHSFLWFNLGEPDIILAVIAAAVYLVQAKLSMINMTEEQKKQMAIMAYISPIMMGVISISAPAALPLYWTVGGSFLILQTYISKKLYSAKSGNPHLVVTKANTTK